MGTPVGMLPGFITTPRPVNKGQGRGCIMRAFHEQARGSCSFFVSIVVLNDVDVWF